MFSTFQGHLLLAAATWFMTGLIWFVQVVHYPLFSRVGDITFTQYANSHRVRTGSVVALPMLAQAALSLWAVCDTGLSTVRELVWLNFFMVFAVWILTAACSVPCHDKLCSKGFSPEIHRWLVATNWLRTILWSLCSVVVGLMLEAARR